MNYLIQAWACLPDKGGEFAVSWGWISHLSNCIGESDSIYVVSLTLKNEHIQEYQLKNVKVIDIEAFEKFKFLENTPLYYWVWQRLAYRKVSSMDIHFDVIHLYSLSDFRQLGVWYKYKNSTTIFGPVGGGQVCPKSLTGYEQKFYYIRNIINSICKYNPFYKRCIKRYSCKYACNKETGEYLKESELLIDVPLNDRLKNLNVLQKKTEEKAIILFCGRLINKKGLFLLLDVIKRIPKDREYEVHIYGEGILREAIENQIRYADLEERVIVKGAVPYEEMTKVYRTADVFVLPSLRESGGSVLVEAMAHALPIVSLDMAFSSILKQNDTGNFIDIHQSTEGILNSFADALVRLIDDSELRTKLGYNGYKYVNNELTWDKMIEKVYGKYI